MNEQLKAIAKERKIPIELYPDFELYVPIFNMIIDECCDIATTSGKPIIAKRIKERLCKK